MDDALAALLRRRAAGMVAMGVLGTALIVVCLWPVFQGETLTDAEALPRTFLTIAGFFAALFGFGLGWKYASIGRIIRVSPWRTETCTVLGETIGGEEWAVLQVGPRRLRPANAASQLNLSDGEHVLEIAGPLDGRRRFVVRRPGTRRFGLYREPTV